MKSNITSNINVDLLKDRLRQEVAEKRRLGVYGYTRSSSFVRAKSQMLINTAESLLESEKSSIGVSGKVIDRISKVLPFRLRKKIQKFVCKIRSNLSGIRNQDSTYNLLKLMLENQKKMISMIDELDVAYGIKLSELESKIDSMGGDK
jgi:hypothetical protein